jgi:hypothetical protein
MLLLRHFKGRSEEHQENIPMTGISSLELPNKKYEFLWYFLGCGDQAVEDENGTGSGVP